MAIRQKEKIIRFYKSAEGAEAVYHLIDIAEQVLKTQKFCVSDFLTPFEQEIAETISNSEEGLEVRFEGGYEGAERKQAMFVHKDFAGNPAFDFAVLDLKWREQFAHLTHRDVLGAVMSTGIERSKIGDINISKGCAKILTTNQMAAYLVQNISQVATSTVEVSIGALEDIAPKEQRCKEIRATVASLRIDSVAAAGFSTSRSRMATDIAADKLTVNWQSIKNVAQVVKVGDIISMKGRGRMEIVEICGTTKKGRISVLLKRYL